MDEQTRRETIRKIAYDMYTAGMGWHEDLLERLTRPPISTAMSAVEAFRIIAAPPPRIAGPRRAKRRSRKRRQ